MKITFLGTGEAFGEKANTSILIDDLILLDCGMQTVQQLMKINFHISGIKLIWGSHLHADHVFGLPAFFCASMEEGRTECIEILGCEGISGYVEKLLFLAYRKKLEDFGFKINFTEISKGGRFEFRDYVFEFAETKHSIRSLAVSVTAKDGEKVTYTGDGENTAEVVNLAVNSDLIISEAYLENMKGHSSVTGAIELFSRSGAKKLALVHVSRKAKVNFTEISGINGNVFMPDDLEILNIKS